MHTQQSELNVTPIVVLVIVSPTGDVMRNIQLGHVEALRIKLIWEASHPDSDCCVEMMY